jgi:drug/metabolite transporter (DMT)-like permease
MMGVCVKLASELYSTSEIVMYRGLMGSALLLLSLRGMLLAGVGLSATAAQMAMTRAYRLGNPLVTANLQYTGIVFFSIRAYCCGAIRWAGQAG